MWSGDKFEQISFRNSQGTPSVDLSFFDTAFVEMKPHSIEKGGHIMNCACLSSNMIKIRLPSRTNVWHRH